MTRTSLDHHNCSFARALELIGDRWSLMIIRDAFYGIRRFSDFKQRLGITQAVLSSRLADLIAHDILSKGPSSHGSGHEEYRLTDRGRDLFPVVISLMQWGDRWIHGQSGPPIIVTEKNSHEPIDPVIVSSRGKALSPKDLSYEPGAGASAETLAFLQKRGHS
jgi:DNA-binding HxlR family transcriptional regulator